MNREITENLVEANTDWRSVWTLPFAVLAVIACAILTAFHADVWKTIQIWYIYPSYSHCFLILPISGWLVWEKRAELARQYPAPDLRVLPLAILPALFWLAGYYSTTIEMRQIAIVGFIEVALLGTLGWRFYRQILFPALFLFFLIPTGEYLIPTLQRLTADFTEWGLNLFGVVHYRDGTVFELANGRYEVAEACAGLRFLTATFTLGTLFSYLSFRHWWKTAAFLAACIAVPVGANGVRVLATIMVANYTDNRVAAGMDHIVYGWGFAVVIMLALLYAGSKFRDPDFLPAIANPPLPKRRVPSRAFVAVALALLAAIALAPAYAAFRVPAQSTPDLATLQSSLEKLGWSSLPLSGDWQPTFNPPSAKFQASLARSGRSEPPVDLVVNVYVNAARDGSLISIKNRAWNADTWSETSSATVQTSLGGEPATFSEHLITSPLGERLVWSCDWIDGHTTMSSLMVKFLQLRAALSSRDEAAIIALSTPVAGSADDARNRLRKFLAQAGGLIVKRLEPVSGKP